MVVSEKVVAKGSGLVIVAVVTDRGTMEWEMWSTETNELVHHSYSHVDAQSWIVGLGRCDWDYAEACVDEGIAWAKRVIRDQDIVLHDAPGSLSTTDADGQ